MKIRVIIRWRAVKPEYARQPFCNIFKQLPCRLTGHNAELEVTTGKLALRCARCGWESPGWTLDGPRFGQMAQHG